MSEADKEIFLENMAFFFSRPVMKTGAPVYQRVEKHSEDEALSVMFLVSSS